MLVTLLGATTVSIGWGCYHLIAILKLANNKLRRMEFYHQGFDFVITRALLWLLFQSFPDRGKVFRVEKHVLMTFEKV